MTTTDELHLLALSGSFRDGSLNRSLLEAVARVAPEGVHVRIHDYADVPHWDGSLDPQPDSVRALRDAIAAADGVLIATPEFNYGVPGRLKNAIDWASRPAYASPFRDKPVGVLGASPGTVGSARAQHALRNVLSGMAAAVFPWPEFLLSQAKTRIEDGVLTDETSLKFLRAYVGGFETWCRALSSYGANAPS